MGNILKVPMKEIMLIQSYGENLLEGEAQLTLVYKVLKYFWLWGP